MRLLLLPLVALAGCATPTPAELPEGIVCVSTLTTTVVTISKASGPVTVTPDCAVHIE